MQLARRFDPIVAIATASGRGAVGIVRVSGESLAPLAEAICGRALAPRHATHVAFRAGDGTTMLQTWLNPTPPDPVQAKMMWIMPLVFSVMFFFFPAGLVLYWLTNNILSITQQWVINKKLGVGK